MTLIDYTFFLPSLCPHLATQLEWWLECQGKRDGEVNGTSVFSAPVRYQADTENRVASGKWQWRKAKAKL